MRLFLLLKHFHVPTTAGTRGPSEVPDDQIWVDEDDQGVGRTLLCPYCEIDSVIGSASGYPITREFLQQMQQYWFDIPSGVDGFNGDESVPLL
jgi:hypothetical protein